MTSGDTKKDLDKRMSLKEAICNFVHDGSSIAFGGMGGEQVVAPTYEIVRQGQRELTLMGDSPCEVGDFLIGTGQIKRIEVAWIAYAIAGVSPSYRRAVEQGVPHEIEVYEFSNYTMGLRFLAGALNVPFMVTKSLLGSSIEQYNDMIKVMEDPYTGQPIALVPAATPDVAIIQVNRADALGNAQFLGFSANSENIARAAKRTIITCEGELGAHGHPPVRRRRRRGAPVRQPPVEHAFRVRVRPSVPHGDDGQDQFGRRLQSLA
jgi:glutaconate CoA-transferase subunit A